MTKTEAIKILNGICNNCTLFPHCVYKKPDCFRAINMAIEALSDDCQEGILTPEERSEVLNAIDDALPSYQIDGYEDTDGMFFKVLISKIESCSEEPNRSEQLTDKEQRIFLAAMGREEEVCKQVDDEWRDCREPYEDSLVRTCHEITRKVKGALWGGN